MNLDIHSCAGDRRKPAVVFIHGLGMDKDIWVNPFRSRILGGKFSLTTLLKRKPKPIVLSYRNTDQKKINNQRIFTFGDSPLSLSTLFDDFQEKIFSVVTWSQQSPAAEIDRAVRELREVIEVARGMTEAGIILIGHSRGGLIGRKYLEYGADSVRALITIATPHQGSSVAHLAHYIAPFVSLISPLFPRAVKGTFSAAVKRIHNFLLSDALQELLPGSTFYRRVRQSPVGGVAYFSIGGTDPLLFSLFRWSFEKKENTHGGLVQVPEELFSIPTFFERIVPEKIYPQELKKGKGDGLVSASSSKFPWDHDNQTFKLNHAALLFDETVRKEVLQKVEKQLESN